MDKKNITYICLGIIVILTGVVLWQAGIFSGSTAAGSAVTNTNMTQEQTPAATPKIEPTPIVPTAEPKKALPDANKPVETVKPTQSSEPKGTKQTGRDEKAVWDEMHKMINTKIVADEIWGKITITPEKIASLISEVEKSNYKTRKDLLNMLNRWMEGDYRKAVEDHNFLWDQLGGTIGKAKDLNEKTKEEMIEKYREN